MGSCCPVDCRTLRSSSDSAGVEFTAARRRPVVDRRQGGLQAKATTTWWRLPHAVPPAPGNRRCAHPPTCGRQVSWHRGLLMSRGPSDRWHCGEADLDELVQPPFRTIGTLVERTSRFLVSIDFINGYDAQGVSKELLARVGLLPTHLRGTLTWDQGTEISDHKAFSAASPSTGPPAGSAARTRTSVLPQRRRPGQYFCDPTRRRRP